ncbi:DUF6887 family protein [Gloeothece verrucosa]|uniref:Uncharacterized protein n=1 Tax=Gloeothece verrucosa (strain PCC 7822) TaxID=497965 RepID=E0UJG4_GLOV7|nr:hypothetical protein [Gloeothece verrucosa]ADN16982.1 conserved hypothetical protein [Gloeothece verrucosa PCC 7822]
MSEVNYAAMSDQQLKQYFLTHRHDEAAFQAYLERRRSQPKAIITKVGDPDFEIKIQEAINQKLQARKTR